MRLPPSSPIAVSAHRPRLAHLATCASALLLLASCKGGTEVCEGPLCNGNGGGTPVATTMTFAQSSLTFTSVGETQQLMVTVRDQNGQVMGSVTISWSSNDPNVATVDNTGLVTAVGNGPAMIMATTGTISATASVTVNDPCLAGAAQADFGTNSGNLATTDCQLSGGSYVDIYTFELETDATLEIDLNSADFDPFLSLFDDQANLIDSNDDGPNGLNSQLVVDLSHGTYALAASTVAAGATGAYSLQIAQVGCPRVGAADVGSFQFGELTGTDCLLPGGWSADSWILDVFSDGRVQIDYISDQFDTWLDLFDDVGNFIDDNDDAHNTGTDFDLNSRIDIDLTTGVYEILANSFDVGETGSYQLTVGPGLPCTDLLGAMAAGQSTTGASLAVDDCLAGTFYSDPYAVRIQTTTTVTFTLTSAAFDAFLLLYDPSGNVVDSDNDSGGGTDAQIAISLTPGWYVIEASSFFDAEIGDYTLSIN